MIARRSAGGSLRRWPLVATVALTLSSCSGAAPRDGGSGSDPCDALGYPCGPFGSSADSVLANFTIDGRRDDNHDGRITDDPAHPLQAADYFDDKKVKALLLFITAEWCIPCRAVQPELVDLSTRSRTDGTGLAVLEVLLQSADGTTADQATIERWATTYRIPFDMGIDPGGALVGDHETMTFPSQLIVTTSDMRIFWRATGIVPGGLSGPVHSALNQ